MNIGIVTQFIYPYDQEIRARKIATSLCTRGHNVSIICRKGKYQKANEKIDCAIVYRFEFFSNCFWLNKFLSIPIPVNLFWLLWILHARKRENLDLLIVRDLRLAFPTILAAKFFRIPIIMDMGENQPAMADLSTKDKFWYYITRNRKLISTLEKICVNLADYIWVVVEENKERLLSLGVKDEKIEVVSNTPILSPSQIKKDYNLIKDTISGNFVVVFVGILTKYRGLDLILKSVPYILKKDFHIKIVIIGDGPDKSRLENLTHQLHVEKVVKFTGWIESKNIHNIIEQADLGLIPHAANELTQTTIPNKLFDYMIAGLPVLSTDLKPVRRILEENKCGLIIPDEPKEVAHLILKLKRSSKLRKRMGRNAQNAIFEKYNWEIESKTIFRTINTLCQKGK